MMSGNRRNNIIIGLLIILTYFLIYTFLGDSGVLKSLGGLPLINCTTSLIRNGFSGRVLTALTKDFAQTIFIIFAVIFVQNLLPEAASRRPGAIIGTIAGYIFLYLASMWFVRYVIFSGRMNEILQMFLAIFAVILAGLGAVLSSPMRRIFAGFLTNVFLRNYLMESRITHWLADSFFISAAILFLAVAIEMTVGLPYFFAVLLGGFPSILIVIVTIAMLYYMLMI